jgi:hypothetical protein
MIFRIPLARFIFASNTYPLFYWLAGAIWGLGVLQQRLLGIKNLKIKGPLLFLVLLLAVVSFVLCFVPFKYSAVSVFIPFFLLGLIFFRRDFEQKISLVYAFVWLCPFLFILMVYSGERFARMAEPVSCLCIVYFSFLIVKVFADFLYNSERTESLNTVTPGQCGSASSVVKNQL